MPWLFKLTRSLDGLEFGHLAHELAELAYQPVQPKRRSEEKLGVKRVFLVAMTTKN